MPPLDVITLGDGVVQLQSRLWATNSLLVSDGRRCVVCDPSIFGDELAEIRTRAAGAAERHVLITHSDWDHTCGIPAFADAVVGAGTRTAKAIADGTAADKLARAAPEWGLGEPGELRVDRILEGGRESDVGPERVLVIDAGGHAPDGSAFLLTGSGLLVTGDYLSPLCYPLLLGSLSEAIGTYQRLLSILRGGGVRQVVPGHGHAMAPQEAVRIGEQDMEYAQLLGAAAQRALRAGASTGEAVLAAYAVVPPRADRIGLGAFGLRSANARQAVQQCRSRGASPGARRLSP